jgi:endo-1,4-beta-xylanase
MKLLKTGLFWALLVCAGILVMNCSDPPPDNNGPIAVTGISLRKSELTLTMFAKEKLRFTLSPPNATNTNVTWSTSTPNVVSVTDDGTVKALSYTAGGTDTDSSAATGTAVIMVKTEDGGFTDTIIVTTSMASQVDVMDLPPLKNRFADYFMMGNVFSSYDITETGIANTLITRHYNIVTPENNLKPSYMYNNNAEETTFETATYNTGNMETAMRMIDAAIASGLKVQGHTLLWHSQLPRWQSNLRAAGDTTSKEDALAWMKEFVTYVVTYYKGKIHAWDVLNEAFTDSNTTGGNWRNVMRSGSSEGNPWYVKIGADFVYEGFKAARLADPDAILYYNDYNLNNIAKATMVRNMVRDVNKQWQDGSDYDGRLLIEGIGMQSHHNTDISVNAIKASLDLFRPLDVKISVSELDVLCMPYNNLGGNGAFNAANSTATNAGKLTAANLYGRYFQLFLENADIIERVTFWGLYDSMSWRSRGLPLPFEGVPPDTFPSTIQAKPAYYKMIEALEIVNGD